MKWILDPGHGGLAFGQYLTPGKRSPEVPPGLYEGAFNRLISQGIATTLKALKGVEVAQTAIGPINIPLKNRVAFVNGLQKRVGNCVLISLHVNAAPGKGWSSARGFTIFKPRRQFPHLIEKSHKLATLIESELRVADYTSSRGIKEANFTIIQKVNCPAVLVEMGFMTNQMEVKALNDPAVQADIIGALVRAMIGFEQGGE
ncbi:hypothetical protein GWN42_13420 [candidate division KSB1 bacterium]|nr:hypothetical protein [candidate division KSB1 bacterium]